MNGRFYCIVILCLPAALGCVLPLDHTRPRLYDEGRDGGQDPIDMGDRAMRPAPGTPGTGNDAFQPR